MKGVEKLPVTEVKVTKIAILLYRVIQTLIQDLDQGSHVGEVFVHLRTVWKVATD